MYPRDHLDLAKISVSIFDFLYFLFFFFFGDPENQPKKIHITTRLRHVKTCPMD